MLEKLIHVQDFPKVEFITSTLVLQQEIKIYFHDFENNSYEIYFPCVYDYRYTIKASFSYRKFELEKNHVNDSIYIVENSDFLKNFIKNTDKIYGEEKELRHYLITEYIDSMMELVVAEPPVLRCLMKKHLS